MRLPRSSKMDAGRAPEPDLAGNRIGGKLGLHGLEQLAIEDRLMLSGVNLAPVHHLAEVEPVLEEVCEGADAEPDAAAHAAVEPGNRLGADAAPVEVLDHGAHRAQFEVAPEDDPDHLGLFRHDHELLVDAAVAERGPVLQPRCPCAWRPRSLSRTRSPITSRSNWAKESSTLRVSRPMLLVVLNDWVTDTNETECWSKSSTSFAKSASERVRRSTL